MFHLFYKYLIFYNYVNIPGVGHFKIEKQPAETKDNYLHAPVSVIKYNNEANAADRSFYNFLAGELNIEVVDAIRQFQEFSSNLKNTLTSRKAVVLPSMGTLKMENNEIKFQAITPAEEYFPAINLDDLQLYKDTSEDEAQLAAEEYEETASRSYWWIYALLFALIAAGAIAYHYYQGGFD